MKNDIVTVERLLALVAVAALGGLAVLGSRHFSGRRLLLGRPDEEPAPKPATRRKARARRAS